MKKVEVTRTIRNVIAFLRVSQTRVSGYMSMLMMATILFKQFNLPIRFFPIGFVVVWLLIGLCGIIDDKLKLHYEEMRIVGDKNPFYIETRKKLDEILEILNGKHKI